MAEELKEQSREITRNGYVLTRAWFDFVLSNGHKIRPIHTALYCWCVEKNNRLCWKDEFQLPTDEACEVCGVADRETILKVIKDLVEWGFIKIVQESTNKFTARYISLYYPIKSDSKPDSKGDSKPEVNPEDNQRLPDATPTKDKPYKPINNKTKKLKKDTISPHLFKDSNYANIDLFIEQFKNTEWEKADLKHYYDSFMDWSLSNNKVKSDWIATVRNGMRKDQKEGKLIIKVNGNKPITSNQKSNRDVNEVTKMLEPCTT